MSGEAFFFGCRRLARPLQPLVGASVWAARVSVGQSLQAVCGMCGEKVWGWESGGQQTVVMGSGTLL